MIVDHQKGLYVVLDGMGGANAGDIASQTPRDAIRDFVTQRRLTMEPKARLEAAIQYGSASVWTSAQQARERHGMGTTVVACLVVDAKRVVIAHVGDSLAYLLRHGRLQSLTRDHTIVEELVDRGVLLRAMTVAEARVVRDRRVGNVPAASLVPGDVLVIEEGDAIPADARVVESIALRVAEAALTGESTPVTKDSNPILTEAALADRSNMVFRGTTVTSGRGRAVVVATGSTTELGKIADALQRTEEEKTPLQKELAWVGKRLGLAVVGIAVVVATTLVVVAHVQSLAQAIQVLLVAVALAVAAVPEGLPAITTVTLSLGVQRMARRRVIVRKLSAVETLGSANVICGDKTGTLTKNEMSVRVVMTASGRADLTGTGYEPRGELLVGGRPLATARTRSRSSARSPSGF